MRRLILILCASCTSGSPDLTVTMSVPITMYINGGPSVLDPLVGHTIDVRFAASSMPYEHTDDVSTACKSTVFAMAESVRTASGDQADLVQREVLDKMDNWSLQLELCGAGKQSMARLAAGDLEHLEAWFTCFLQDGGKAPDATGYPRLISFTSSACTAVIDDISVQRNYMTAEYTTTYTVGPDSLP